MASFDIETVAFDPGKPAAVEPAKMRSDCADAATFAMAGQGGIISVYGRGPAPVVPKNKWPKRVDQWRDLIRSASNKWGIPASLIAGVISIESGGIPEAKSPAGALGLMQLMPSTYNWLMGRPKGTPVDFAEATDPERNIDLGSNLLRKLMVSTGGNLVALAADYNAGKQRCGNLAECQPDDWNLKVNCGYVDHVLGGYNAAIDAGYEPYASPFVKPQPSSSKTGIVVVALASMTAAVATAWIVRARKDAA